MQAYVVVEGAGRRIWPRYSAENFPATDLSLYQDSKAGGKNIGLGAGGEELTFTAYGPDATLALEEIRTLLSRDPATVGNYGTAYFLGGSESGIARQWRNHRMGQNGYRAYRPPGVKW